MNVRVVAGQRVSAVLAPSARPRLRPRAQETLAEPERQALLPDSQRALEQKRSGERVPSDRVVEPAPDGVVAMQWEERHGRKLRESDRLRRVAEQCIAGTKRDRGPRAFDTRRERWNSG